jgi:Rrf2 family protein
LETLNSKVEYALLAALDLTRRYDPDTTVTAREIAENTGAPEKYLGEILRQLRNQALVKSEKGPTGGYRLMRPPDMISVAEIIAAVSAEGDGRRRRSLPQSDYAGALRWLASELARRQQVFLSGMSLQDFLQHVDQRDGNRQQEG